MQSLSPLSEALQLVDQQEGSLTFKRLCGGPVGGGIAVYGVQLDLHNWNAVQVEHLLAHGSLLFATDMMTLPFAPIAIMNTTISPTARSCRLAFFFASPRDARTLARSPYSERRLLDFLPLEVGVNPHFIDLRESFSFLLMGLPPSQDDRKTQSVRLTLFGHQAIYQHPEVEPPKLSVVPDDTAA